MYAVFVVQQPPSKQYKNGFGLVILLGTLLSNSDERWSWPKIRVAALGTEPTSDRI